MNLCDNFFDCFYSSAQRQVEFLVPSRSTWNNQIDVIAIVIWTLIQFRRRVCNLRSELLRQRVEDDRHREVRHLQFRLAHGKFHPQPINRHRNWDDRERREESQPEVPSRNFQHSPVQLYLPKRTIIRWLERVHSHYLTWEPPVLMDSVCCIMTRNMSSRIIHSPSMHPNYQLRPFLTWVIKIF